nr:hypothetical protein [uncultured Anaerobutyricum sp.]
MNEFGGLIEKISSEFGIKKDIGEAEEMWMARVVYSVAGRMAEASLYDVLEENQSVSVTHLKRRCQKVLEAYFDLYPNLQYEMAASVEEYVDEIYNILLASGYVYHKDKRLQPPNEKRVALKNIEVQRGTVVGEKLLVSGIGTYLIKSGKQSIEEVMDMFQIPTISLADYGNHLIKSAQWSTFETSVHTEYLRTEPPFTKGYWKDTPDTDGRISLLRTGEQGRYLYYLYKNEQDNMETSTLPSWMVEGSEYRTVSNSILAANGTLPSLKVEKNENKKTVLIKQEYLLPNAVMNFVKLYSWPARFLRVPSDFNRVMNKEVFKILREILQVMEIEVKEDV